MIAFIQLGELKEWIPWIIAGANAIAAILWGVHFRRSSDRLIAAKDAQINRLESEIKSLERLSPPVLQDWLEASQKMAKAQVDGKDREITTLKEQIQALRDDHLSRTQLIERLERLTADLELEKKGLETKLPMNQLQFEPSVRKDYPQHRGYGKWKDKSREVFRSDRYAYTSSARSPYSPAVKCQVLEADEHHLETSDFHATKSPSVILVWVAGLTMALALCVRFVLTNSRLPSDQLFIKTQRAFAVR